MPENPRRRPLFGPIAKSFLVLGIGASLAAVAVLGNLADLFRGSEDRALAMERAKRRALWAAGQTLPGTPDLGNLDRRLAAKGMALGSPILMRVYKREFELEIWKRRGERFEHFATYPICSYSGSLGPKIKTGDKQAPEGFYTVSAAQLNPNSRWHRSFDLGFPNAYDRSHGRTGSFLMVHGGCSSVGCYAMTDAVVDEVWRIVTAALSGGQRRFQVQAFPFRMTEQNLAERASSEHAAFWRSLKAGADLFDATGLPPEVAVCNASYTFRRGARSATASAGLIRPCAATAEPRAVAGRTRAAAR